jgi:hypothetical protein
MIFESSSAKAIKTMNHPLKKEEERPNSSDIRDYFTMENE